MVMYICNPSAWEVEAGGFGVLGQPRFHSEFQANLVYRVKPFLKIKELANKSYKHLNQM